LRTVAVILANPRYTGREVWNRRRAGRPDGRPVSASHLMDCVVSKTAAHPALVTEADFAAVQTIRAQRPAKDGRARVYALSGLVRCRLCDRRLDSHWSNGRPGYRCRHGHSSTRCRGLEHVKSYYVREDRLVDELAARLADHPVVRCAASEHPRRGAVDAKTVASVVRDSHLVIMHDGVSWSFESQDDPRSGRTSLALGQR